MIRSMLCWLLPIFTLLSYGQNNTINYKALVTDNLGNPLVSQSIDIRFTIYLDASQIYQEVHNTTTDANGIAIVDIGNGTSSDTFSDIKWYDGLTTIMVEIDSGSGYVDLGTSEFKSVPYALDAPGLKKVTQSSNTGWQIFTEFIPDGAGRAPIGDGAVDFSNPGDSTWDYMGASGMFSFAANSNNWASGNSSSAFGDENQVSGDYSTSFGEANWVSGRSSLVTGFNNEVGADQSIATGEGHTSSGNNSLTSGYYNNVTGDNSQASGSNLLLSSNNALAIGENNIDDANAAFIIGNGVDGANRFNAMTVSKTGKTSVYESTTSGTEHAINGIKNHTGFADAAGVYGENTVEDYYGFGVYGIGGYVGVLGEVSGTSSGVYFGSYGSAHGVNTGTNYGVYGYATGGSLNYAVYASGDMNYTGTLTNVSDKKFKQNIESLDGHSVLNSLLQLNPTSYTFKPEYIKSMNVSSKPQIGFIAQELQSVFPNLVSNNVHPNKSKDEPSIEYLGVNYIGLIPILTASVKEQQKIIEQQQETIDTQHQMLEDLIRRVELLENR